MTSIGSNEAAIDAMRAGASDYIIKPVAPERLMAALSMAADKSKELGELHPLTEKITQPLAFEEFIGSAPALRTALAIAAKAAGLKIIAWSLERSPPLIQGADWYYKSLPALASNDGVILQLLHVLAKDVGVMGVFSDWPATTTFYANCLLDNVNTH